MRSGGLSYRTCCCAAKTVRGGGTICGGCLTVCGMRRGPVGSGVTRRASTARGGRSTSRCGGGWTRVWLDAGVSEALVADVQSVVREWAGRKGQPSAVCTDSRTLPSTPESGARAGYDGAKRRKGSKGPHRGGHAGPSAGPDRHPGPVRETATRLRRWPPKCSRSPEARSGWPTSTGDTPGQTPSRPHSNTASGLKWSSTPWPGEASCCCHADGS